MIKDATETCTFDGREVTVFRRPRQRHMNLIVKPDGRIRITCNRRRSKREIALFVEESRSFIDRRLEEIAEFRRLHPAKNFLTGERLLFLGEERTLEVIWSWTDKIRVEHKGPLLEMISPLSSSPADRLTAFQKFCRSWAKRHVPGRVDFFSQLMSLTPTALSIRGQRTRWGSCSGRGEISLNWKLMAAPFEVIDYVVVHELAHLIHPNHSDRFWDLVGQFHPNWRASRQWLREHQTAVTHQFSAPAL